MDHSDRYCLSVMATGIPVWHFGEYAGCFHVEGAVASAEHFDMGDISVGIYDEAAGDSSLDTSVVRVAGIFAMGIDIGEQSFGAAGELRFFIHKIIFKHLFHGVAAVGGEACVDAASLCAVRGREKYGEKARKGNGEEPGEIESRGDKSHERFLNDVFLIKFVFDCRCKFRGYN